jgi:hypothetical protein
MNEHGGWLEGIPMLLSAILMIWVLKYVWDLAILQILKIFISTGDFAFILLEISYYLFGIALLYIAWNTINSTGMPQ